MLPIQHGARALGVTDHELRRLAEQGAVPGAVERDGQWLIPTTALVPVAKQQGWTLDLALLQQQLDEQGVGRYTGDMMAAQAAVLLAKTQATAARVESRDLLRRLREETARAEADRAARLEAAEALADSEQEMQRVRRHHAVAEARLAELRRQLAGEDQQIQFMIDRINSLEQERFRLSQSLGWLGRLRYRRMISRQLSRPTPAAPSAERSSGIAGADQRPAPPPPWSLEAEGTQSPPTAAPPPPVDDYRGPAIKPTELPPVSIQSASTVTYPVDDSVVADVAEPSASRATEPSANRAAGPATVPRSGDGRFDQSALATMRSNTPLAAP